MENSVELLRYVKEERLLKCLLMAGKLFQGVKTRSEKRYVYINTAIMRIKFVGMTSSV